MSPVVDIVRKNLDPVIPSHLYMYPISQMCMDVVCRLPLPLNTIVTKFLMI